MKKYIYLILLVASSSNAFAQFIAITNQSASYTENFNSLATSGTTQTLLPSGWWINELPGNTTYRAGDGSLNSGDTYSFGTGTNTERSLGGVASGSVVSNFGVKYINNSGSAFSSFNISMFMEQWRAGGRTGLDSLYFFYAINGGLDSAGTAKVSTGTNWIRVPACDLLSKVTPTAAGALDGNLPANRTSYQFTVTGLTVNVGDTLWLRWRDPNAAGSDDGLSIDDYSFTVGGVSAPPPLQSLIFNNTNTNSTAISWTKNTSYIDSTMTTLVFAKPINSITLGTPTFSENAYTANNNFLLANSLYQNDALAKCIFKGDTNTFSLTNLTQNTLYQIIVLAVKTADSSYFPAIAGSFSTQNSAPNAITSLALMATGETSVKITWNKPVNYSNSNNTIVVYAKAVSAINSGIPTTNPINIIADSNFTGSGSTLAFDANAKCVYKGDSNFVNISGLNAGTNYIIRAFAINDADSNYSLAANTQGFTISLGPAAVKSIVMVSLTPNSSNISWTKDTTYNNNAVTTLVYLKQGNAISQNVPSKNATSINANDSFGIGSPLETDLSAFCIYKGDSTFTIAQNLNPNTTYHLLIYVVKDIDSQYSNPTASSVLTRALPPSNVSNASVTGLTTTSARIAWTKPIAYANATQSTLVFVKATNAINTGTPSVSVNFYTANNNVPFGTPYQNDSSAKCVFKGDTNFVNIDGINNNTNYEVLIYVVRDVDSTYATSPVTSSGTAAPTPPPPSNVNGTSVIGLTTTSARVSWTKPSNYSNTDHTTLVFVKLNSMVDTSQTPSRAITFYNANAITPFGTPYQNDTNARCLFKGDTNFVNISAISNNNTYHVLIYVVRDIDSTYSTNAVLSSGSANPTPPPPNNVNSLTVTGLNTSSARISWVKPISYANSTSSILVFVKPLNAVDTNNAPSRTVGFYTANPVAPFGTAYQHDLNAKCVYKGDTNFVNISGLNNSITYHILVYVVRDDDSVYATNAAIGSGTAIPNPPTAPYYQISQINRVRLINGVPDSLNVKAELRGIVYGVNQRTASQGGIQFLLNDNTGGITISSNSNNFGYTVSEGDSISVTGIVSSTRGLLLLNTLDTLKLLGTGKAINNPILVNKIDESTENKFIRLNKVRFLNKISGNWIANIPYQIITATNDTTELRLFATNSIVGKPVPASGYFHVIGFGSQASNINAPYAFSGYQIIPISTNDIISIVPLSSFALVAPSNISNIDIKGDTNQLVNFSWNKTLHHPLFALPNYTLLLDVDGANFTIPIASFSANNNGLDTTLSIKYSKIRELLLTLGVLKGQTKTLIWTVRANSENILQEANNAFKINFTLQSMIGIKEETTVPVVVAYPNPCKDFIVLKLNNKPLTSYEVMDVAGKTYFSATDLQNNSETTINTNELKAGVYLVKIMQEGNIYWHKFVKE
jgi:hypothetical protein